MMSGQTNTPPHVTPDVSGLRGQGKTSFPKRFYQDVTVSHGTDGFGLMLDGRPAMTPARNPLKVPNEAIAAAVAEEWTEVAEVIDPRRMPLTRLVNSVIDGVRVSRQAVFDEVVRFAASDLLAYRAGEPERLVRAQADAWDPIMAWSRDELHAPFILSEGITFVKQPESSLRRLAETMTGLIGDDAAAPFRLGALHVMTTLTGSLLLAAAVAAGRLSGPEAWRAAHVDEDFQIGEWGADDEASERRSRREIDWRAATSLYNLSRGD